MNITHFRNGGGGVRIILVQELFKAFTHKPNVFEAIVENKKHIY